MTPSSRDPVPLRSPATSGDPSRIRATSRSSRAVSLFSASTFWRTLTISRVSSRRATKSKHSPRSPCGRERKNPVLARPRLVSSRTRSRFIGHSSCGLLYKFPGRVLPGRFAVDYTANPLSRSRPSPSPMAGELLDERVRDSLPRVPGPEGPRLRRRGPRGTGRFPGVSPGRRAEEDPEQVLGASVERTRGVRPRGTPRAGGGSGGGPEDAPPRPRGRGERPDVLQRPGGAPARSSTGAPPEDRGRRPL